MSAPEEELLAERQIARVLAPNPGPLTLEGTNSWVVGRSPAWVVDPGPSDTEHLERLRAAVDDRGGLGGVVLTHAHADHSEAAATLAARYGVPVAAGAGEPQLTLADGERVGPFEVVADAWPRTRPLRAAGRRRVLQRRLRARPRERLPDPL